MVFCQVDNRTIKVDMRPGMRYNQSMLPAKNNVDGGGKLSKRRAEAASGAAAEKFRPPRETSRQIFERVAIWGDTAIRMSKRHKIKANRVRWIVSAVASRLAGRCEDPRAQGQLRAETVELLLHVAREAMATWAQQRDSPFVHETRDKIFRSAINKDETFSRKQTTQTMVRPDVRLLSEARRASVAITELLGLDLPAEAVLDAQASRGGSSGGGGDQNVGVVVQFVAAQDGEGRQRQPSIEVVDEGA